MSALSGEFIGDQQLLGRKLQPTPMHDGGIVMCVAIVLGGELGTFEASYPPQNPAVRVAFPEERTASLGVTG